MVSTFSSVQVAANIREVDPFYIICIHDLQKQLIYSLMVYQLIPLIQHPEMLRATAVP